MYTNLETALVYPVVASLHPRLQPRQTNEMP